MERIDRIKEFVREEIMFDEPDAELKDDTSLLSGVMDSLALLQLIAFLEEEFAIDIDDADMVADNFRTPAQIDAFVQSRVDAKVSG